MARKSVGGSAGKSATRIVVLPKPQRSWLLAGTALVTGALGAALLQPGPARADPTCQESGAPNEWSCEGALNSETFTPDGQPWLIEFGNPPGTPVTQTGGTIIDNDGDFTGEFILNDGSTISNFIPNGSGLIINNANPDDSTATLTLEDDVSATDDAIRVENGATVIINMTDSDVAGGVSNGDNGVLVNAIEDQFTLDIDSESSVKSFDVAIFVAQGASFDNLVEGAVTITNKGVVESTDKRDVIHVDASGAINITNDVGATLTGGTGVDVHGNNTINITNFGSVGADNAGEAGILVENDSETAATTIKNLSLDSIVTLGDGIHAEGNGGEITVYNGDDSINPPPDDDIPDNPDGFIDAQQDGIDITNNNGGNINVFNGKSSDSNAEIFAGGQYGIFANSVGDGGRNGDVSLWNFGYVETFGTNADAAIYGQTSELGTGNFVEVFNGAALVADPIFNINARLAAYEHRYGAAHTHIFDANGIEVVKLGGDGGVVLNTYDFDTDSLVLRVYGVVTRNYGTWDFTGDDDYLSPNSRRDGTQVDAELRAGTTGGIFAPGGSALVVRNFSNADSGLWNYGTMIGEGSNGDPVLDIETTHFDDGTQGIGVPNQVYIYNAGYDAEMGTFGVMGSEAIPSNWDVSAQDAFGLSLFTSGTGNLIDDVIDSGFLADFADASNDQLILARDGSSGDGASVFFYNEGLAVGQVELRSVNGSLLVNDGAWLTRGASQFVGDTNELFNYGLIQASFIAGQNSQTEFQGLEQTDNYGVVSLMDGGAGDEFVFGGNYTGGGFVDGTEYAGLYALDARLAGDNDPDAMADEFFMNEASGSTGLIIRNANPDGSTAPNTFGIDVVEANFIDTSCSGGSVDGGDSLLCHEGDIFFLSLLTPDSFALGGGVNGIEDGLYGWYLFQDNVWEDFELRQTLVGPGTLNAPSIITGAQNIWYATASVVEDHSYGHQFASSGGGGADLPEAAPVYEPAPTSGGTRTGLWVKGTGSWIDRDTTVTELGVDVDTSSSQDIYSLLGGADMKWTEDSPWRIGLFGGYITSSMDFDLGSDSVDYEGGAVGGYLAFNNGAFYADATVKGDILSADYSFSTVDVDADVTNIGVLANTGYRMHWGGAFFEPIGSLAYVHSEVDNVSTGGATVDFSNGQSFRLGAGARLGTTFATGGGTTELSLLGKVWNEFEDANEVTVSDGMNTATFSDDISGVFGEVTGTVSLTSADGTLSGFVTGGGKFGDDFTSWDAKVGLRKSF